MKEGVVKNLIRVGKLSSFDKTKGTCRVIFDDKNNLVSGELCIFEFADLDKLTIGAQVVCIFLANGIQQGFCLGQFYSDINLPEVTN